MIDPLLMTTTAVSAGLWAEREFGAAKLGNVTRTKRLVSMAETAAEQKGASGTISAVFRDDGAGREGAYKFIERHGDKNLAVGRAAGVSAFKRAGKLPFVVVPVDGTSLTALVNDREGEFGPVGNSRSSSRGLTVMHAVMLTPTGTPLGVAEQVYWTRSEVLRTKDRWARRKMAFEDKETAQWLHVMERVLDAQEEAGFEGVVWFQADRGADFTEFIAWSCLSPCWTTVRANANRNVVGSQEKKLWETLSAVPRGHKYSIDVPRTEKRAARTASMELKFSEVILTLPRACGWNGVQVPVYAVLVRETSTVPRGEEPIEWLLITTRPIRTVREARQVVKAYALRWRIEECHKTWKSVTRVEDNQLHTAGAFNLWARILFSVSVRAERLKRLSRENADLPASTEFTGDELEALRLRRKKTRSEMKAVTMSEAIDWVARLGGYIGKSSGGPPGSITIGRGLQWLEVAASTVAAMRNAQ